MTIGKLGRFWYGLGFCETICCLSRGLVLSISDLYLRIMSLDWPDWKLLTRGIHWSDLVVL